jgi:predicted RNA binding protein YcfA (HicA-like mRNA interferase family)
LNPQRLLRRLTQGSLTNVAFGDFRRLVETCGFELIGVRGSHHIYRHPQILEKLNLQPVAGEAKPYQIRQFLALAEKYHLKPEE